MTVHLGNVLLYLGVIYGLLGIHAMWSAESRKTLFESSFVTVVMFMTVAVYLCTRHIPVQIVW